MSDLKPCPFCGGMPKVNDWTLKGITDKRCFCDNEKCPVYLSKTIAIDDWNIRPIEDALNARIAELEAERRWIPVSERLPKEKQSVLALDRTGTAYHWEYSKCLSNIFVGYYTHWMPLPNPPEVK